MFLSFFLFFFKRPDRTIYLHDGDAMKAVFKEVSLQVDKRRLQFEKQLIHCKRRGSWIYGFKCRSVGRFIGEKLS